MFDSLERILEALGVVGLLQALLVLLIAAVGSVVFETQCYLPPYDRTPGGYSTSLSYPWSSGEVAMIKLAEAAYPPRDAVVALAAVAGEADEELPETDAWWYTATDGILVPYAITTGAIEYYKALLARWSADPAQAPWDYADFRYDARATHYETLEKQGEVMEDVYVVSMDLTVSCTIEHDTKSEAPSNAAAGCSCGPGPDVYITKHRTVILKSTGEVLHIYGDGPAEVGGEGDKSQCPLSAPATGGSPDV